MAGILSLPADINKPLTGEVIQAIDIYIYIMIGFNWLVSIGFQTNWFHLLIFIYMITNRWQRTLEWRYSSGIMEGNGLAVEAMSQNPADPGSTRRSSRQPQPTSHRSISIEHAELLSSTPSLLPCVRVLCPASNQYSIYMQWRI